MDAVIDSPERSSVAGVSAIQVAIIYEEFLSGARAKHFADRLAEGLDSSCSLADSVWRCDMLEDPALAERAADAVADCDYLIVSLRGDRDLSVSTREWIAAQVDRAAGHLICVIALLGSDDGKSRVMEANRQYLRGVCAAKRVEFFSHAGIPEAATPAGGPGNGNHSLGFDFQVRPHMPAPLDD